MKKEVGAFEAKTHLPKLLKAVSTGATFIITRRGEAVAELIPAQKKEKKDIQSLIADLRKWRRGITWGKNMSTELAKKEGRK